MKPMMNVQISPALSLNWSRIFLPTVNETKRVESISAIINSITNPANRNACSQSLL
ncbi:hypothetical protein METP1_02953 [Methanosarcinales archaeon]|nr:hypothetical protein METP1_02953 [Methanosarcinales archaeon]